jgi:hypothetical protein
MNRIILLIIMCLLTLTGARAGGQVLALGLSEEHFRAGEVPEGWKLRRFPGRTKGARAGWVTEDGVRAVKLSSKANLTFLEKTVDIDVSEYPVVAWKWKVENILEGNDERTREGDDHPVRLFFVFEPDESEQSFWFRVKRFLYLDRIHGHPYGGRFIEYLWSSHLAPGEVIDDPGKPWQKLVVIEGGSGNTGKWLSYERNLYEDFRRLYHEETRRLIFIGILSDTDQTGQEAVSYIAELVFRREGTVKP